jgi:hypothetical protein
MPIKSVLKPEGSIIMGAATAIMVYAVYDRSLPDASTMHATAPYDINLEAGRKKAVWTSAALLSAVSLLTRDVNVFILGGATLIALDIHARTAIVSAPDTGQLVSPGTVSPGVSGQGYASASGQGASTGANLSLVS